MRCNAEIEVAASVPDITLDQLIAAAGAARYIGLQQATARVRPLFDDLLGYESYVPRFDLSFVARLGSARPDISAEEIAGYFNFRLFEDHFLRRFCGDLLLGSEAPARRELEGHFDSLQGLVMPAREEFEQYRDLELLGPLQYRFYESAESLVDFITALIDRRLAANSNQEAVFELLAQLGGKL